jgi:hypothetical protein
MAKRKDADDEELASSGHSLGQMVGDWFEEFFVLPLLDRVAQALKLYLDHRFKRRDARGDRIIWPDEDNNEVSYDFVMEVDGTEQQKGIPVAFFEGCWRRGTRHSKDKARDDVGKLSPMRHVHPTARFLGMLVSGDFTAPARTFVQSRQVDLLYIPKAKIISAFSEVGVRIDYPDRSSEAVKAGLVEQFQKTMDRQRKIEVAAKLRELVGAASLNTYVDRVRAALAALPQEIRCIARRNSQAAVFETITEATAFLANPHFDFDNATEDFVYEITYTDGTDFEKEVGSIEAMKELHRHLERLVEHITSLTT